MSRRVRITILFGGLAVVALGLALSYRPLVRWRVRRAVDGWARRHGLSLSVGGISVAWKSVTLHSVTLRSVEGCPLVQDAGVRVDLAWGWFGSIRPRKVLVKGGRFCLERLKDGTTNLDRLFRKKGGRAGTALSMTITDSALLVRDRIRKVIVSADSMDAGVVSGRWDLALGRVFLRFHDRSASLTRIRLWGKARKLERLRFEGGRFALFSGLVVTDVQGGVRRDDKGWSVKVTGGYGGVSAKLWNIDGVVRPHDRSASLDLTVQRFSLDKLDRVLDRSDWGKVVVRRGRTRIAADLHLDLRGGIVRLSGVTALSNLVLRDPRIAKDDVRGLNFAADCAGTYDARRDRLHLDKCLLRSNAVALSVKMDVSRIRSKPRILLSLSLARMDCGRLFAAVPKALMSKLSGVTMRGPVSGRIDILVDFGYLTEETVSLDAHIHFSRCRVSSIPFALSAARLRGSFVQQVRDGSIVTRFTVGPSNPDYVPLDMISRHVVNAILTTEDSRFFSHHGFIPREFRRALARNIISRRFRYGASSISMQLVKNVLLGREKTLARKLQELILTAYIERHLSKRRILEIYLNVIEFGPGIYGIGKAARFYFGKPAALLEPQEAAFFSTLLPDPKRRFRFYCRGSLTKKWRNWVDRILVLMHHRHRLTTQELEEALETPILFSRQEFLSRSSCRAKIRRYLGR